MRLRFLALMDVLAVILIAVVAVASVPVGGQTRSPAANTTKYTPPRTPDGQPDLQGVWSHNSATPLERPKELQGRQFLTEEEVAALKRHAAELFNGDTDAAFGDNVFLAALRSVKEGNKGFTSTDTTGNYNHFWLVDREFDNRTSLIVDPADGRMPALTPEAQKRQGAAAERRRLHPFDGPEDIALSQRCVTGNVPMLGAGYNNYYQIAQTRAVVAINMEMRHDTRIIPLDGRPHLSSKVRHWLGDSRGRWEGDTLVVETTNFNDKAEFRTVGAAVLGDANMRLTERFTRVSRDTLKYEATVDDPTTYTKPWTAVAYMKSTKEKIYEFACHEGNESMPGTLSGARAQEKAAAEKGPTR